jgi:hemerythrin-like domain-containing protein
MWAGMTSAPPPDLLNEDGSASMATAFLMSHHAFRRDIGCFGRALAKLDPKDSAKVEAMRQEWKWFRGALHGHHEMEDTRVFPHLRSARPELGEAIDRLSSEHQQIDPLLVRGDAALGESVDLVEARHVVGELQRLLDRHLAFEEERVVPTLRAAREFPAPASDEEAAQYAQGFAWSSHGVAPRVLERLGEILSPALAQRLPAARAEFEQRWTRTWGDEPTTASTTSIPGH